MKRFAQLFEALDQTTRTNQKVAALEKYFLEVPPADAAWALHFLCGHKLARAVSTPLMRSWAAEEAALPLWLVEECYDAVGDLAETVALLLPPGTEGGLSLPLHQMVEERLLPLRSLPEPERKALLLQTWRELHTAERMVWNKLITGSFRVGVARTLVVRALANLSGVEPAVMAHRLMGTWKATAADYERLINPDSSQAEPARAYPFFLASPLEGEPSGLGDLAEWQAEWKWDGIRAQLIRRQGQVLVWSRGDELVTGTFPELAEAGRALPEGTVLDGEILAWEKGQPLPFNRLQRRLGRKGADAKLRAEVPVVFLAYDLLEERGEDLRTRSLEERRSRLQALYQPLHGLPLEISPLLTATAWPELVVLQQESRARGVEGLMLKRRSSPYQVGRVRGDWWKWKVDPFVVDAVLIYAQRGHGRRASLYTDYTFGVWKGDQLVPVAKAYSGLTDVEIGQVDAFVKAHTREKFGPVVVVDPELVFELAFEGIQVSSRHKAGLALRFPRMNRWRQDKKAAEADTLESLQTLLGGGA